MGAPTVACVFKPGNGFTNEYVTRLRDGVRKHCQAPHRFVCLTNERLPGVETLPLLRNRVGWWNKLELFRKGLFDDCVIYFDLDTMIVDDITDIVTHEHRFTGLCDFTMKYGYRRLQSAFMAWDGRLDLSHLDEKFQSSDVEKYSQGMERWGDQGYILDHLGESIDYTDELFPGRFCSYKWHVRRPGKVPEGASIVCFHGKPRPADIGWRLP